MEFEWQQGSSCLQDSSQYSSRSQQSCSLDGPHSSPYFQVLQSLYQSIVTVPRAPITIGIIVSIMFHSFFYFSCKVQVLFFLFAFFQFYFVSPLGQQSPQFCKFSFLFFSSLLFFFFFFLLLIIIRSGRLAEIRWSICTLKSHRSLYVPSPGQMLGCAYTISSYNQILISCTIPWWSLCPPSRI